MTTFEQLRLHLRRHRLGGRLGIALAFGWVMFALTSPDDLGRLTPGSFVRIPLEGLLGIVLVLVLPRTAGRVVTVLAGVGLGLLTILKVLDTASIAVLGRQYNLVLDWAFLPDGLDFLVTSIGRAGTVAVVIGIVVLVLAIPALTVLSLLRLSRLVIAHRSRTTSAVAVLGVAWVTSSVLAVHLVPGKPGVGGIVGTQLAYDAAADEVVEGDAVEFDHSSKCLRVRKVQLS
jgi:hypothetical protein